MLADPWLPAAKFRITVGDGRRNRRRLCIDARVLSPLRMERYLVRV